jgi:hypothetical protein
MDRSTTTEANGEYVLDALEAGEERAIFHHPKHVMQTKSVTLKGKETRLDVQMSSGQKVTGVVVTEAGAPVPEAEVAARAGTNYQMVRSNASGAFEFTNLASGRYRFSATKSGFAEGSVEDVDISDGAPVRITLPSGGTIYGRVTGLSPEELSSVAVRAVAGRDRAEATVDASGNYRIQGAPIGTVRVNADFMSFSSGTTRSSSVQIVELSAGGSQQVDLDFGGAISIQGRVVRNGAPLKGGNISFAPKSAFGGGGFASSSIDESGRYSVSGVQDGEYNVHVMDMQRFSPYTTTYQVRGSATFDIEYRTGMIRGRVTDAETGEPVSNASVTIRTTTPGESFMPARGAVTDTAGAFVMDGVQPGAHTITASKDGYANQLSEVQMSDRDLDGVELKIAKNDGVLLKVVDGRDGRPIRAMVFVYDMQGRVVQEETRFFFMGGNDTESKLRLGPGTYSVAVSSTGYAPRNITVQSPSSPTVALTPGGTLVIQSRHSERRVIRLIDASGTPYFRMSSRPPDRELLPSPGSTPMPNVAPGTYTLQLLGANNTVVDQKQVTVSEGQTVTTEI